MAHSLIALSFLLTTLLLGVFFAYVFSLKRQAYLLLWTAGWAFYGLHYLAPALSFWTGWNPLLNALNAPMYGFASLCFFLGAQLYTRQKPWITPAIVFAIGLLIWAAANAFGLFSITSIAPSSFVLLAAGILFWRESRHYETIADRLLAAAFVGWGLLFLSFRFLQARHTYLADAFLPVSGIPTAFVAVLLIMAIYEEEKRRVERNMLALSNLNLATSSFVGGEIQRMLAQALDRVLGVVRLPAGALFLHHGDPSGPTSVVSAGLPDEFCRITQEEGLDDYLVGLVSRLGGLLGFRDLRDDNLTALEKDEPIRRFRELALRHGLRSAVVE